MPPIENARFNFNLMANDPRLNAEDGGYPLATDSDLPGVPKFLGAMSARRDGCLFDLPGWIGGTAGYVGPSRHRLSPTTVTDMGDYVTSELAASVALGSWSATLRLDNLFGGTGDTFGYGNPFLVDRETVITLQRPRNLSLHCRDDFEARSASGPGEGLARTSKRPAEISGAFCLDLGAGGRDRLSLTQESGKQAKMVAGAQDRRSLRGRIPSEFSVPYDPDNPLSLLFNAYDLTNVRKDGEPRSNP